MSAKKTKSVKSLFFRNKNIISEKKKLAALKRRQEEVINNLQKIVYDYNNSTIDITNNDWLGNLSLESLNDLYKVSNNNKHDYVLTTMQLHSKLKVEHSKNIEENVQLSRDIFINNIELLLAKIDCIQNKIER